MAYKVGVLAMIFSCILAGCSDKSSKKDSSPAVSSASSSDTSPVASRQLDSAGLIPNNAKLQRPPEKLSRP